MSDGPKTLDWLEAELQDTLDEMLENELSEPMLSMELRELIKDKQHEAMDRVTYYRNLLRLQAELIKLQDWIERTGPKFLSFVKAAIVQAKGA